jgi:hypothetical protein
MAALECPAGGKQTFIAENCRWQVATVIRLSYRDDGLHEAEPLVLPGWQ